MEYRLLQLLLRQVLIVFYVFVPSQIYPKIPTKINLFEWAQELEERGAGEILFTSMDHDGTKNGFANEALARLSETINIPIIASGGAGCVNHFIDTFKTGKADAALAASVFHFGEINIPDLKKQLNKQQIAVRI